jgi:hypothetical protein
MGATFLGPRSEASEAHGRAKASLREDRMQDDVHACGTPRERSLSSPLLADLHDLYAHGFLADDDLVRAETSPRWVRAGAMPALHGVRERRSDPRRVGMLLAALIALAAGLGFLLAR